MPKKKRSGNSQAKSIVRDITRTSGDVIVAGDDVTTTHITIDIDARTAEIKQLFDQLYSAIESRTETLTADKEDLKAEVREIQATVADAARKNEKVDEGFLSRRFRNIARMAPDVLDVVVKTLANPALGIGEVARKIAAKAKEETKS